MRICIPGDFSSNMDEGYKNVGIYLSLALERKHEVTRLNIKNVLSFEFWTNSIKLKPDMFLPITQPTNMSLLMIGVVRKLFNNPKIMISTLRPEKFYKPEGLTLIQRILLKFAKPDIIFLQNSRIAEELKKIGLKATLLPNGVNLERFLPVNEMKKIHLRKKYGIDSRKRVILHVGHLEKKRNILSLACLVDAGMQVIICGSVYLGENEKLINKIMDKGISVIKGFQPKVEELYQLADCYVFPVNPGDSLSMPLSVLEAMSCNLPVVTKRFGGLVSMIKEGNGLIYYDGEEMLLGCVEKGLRERESIQTRRLVQDYSWERIADEIMNHYKSV